MLCGGTVLRGDARGIEHSDLPLVATAWRGADEHLAEFRGDIGFLQAAGAVRYVAFPDLEALPAAVGDERRAQERCRIDFLFSSPVRSHSAYMRARPEARILDDRRARGGGGDD